MGPSHRLKSEGGRVYAAIRDSARPALHRCADRGAEVCCRGLRERLAHSILRRDCSHPWAWMHAPISPDLLNGGPRAEPGASGEGRDDPDTGSRLVNNLLACAIVRVYLYMYEELIVSASFKTVLVQPELCRRRIDGERGSSNSRPEQSRPSLSCDDGTWAHKHSHRCAIAARVVVLQHHQLGMLANCPFYCLAMRVHL